MSPNMNSDSFHPQTIKEDEEVDVENGMTTVNLDYGEVKPTPKRPSRANMQIRVSALPDHIRKSAMKLDVDCDGALGVGEVAAAIDDLSQTKSANRNLRKAIAAFVVVCLLLIACIFGASITAARLSNELSIDPEDGFAYVKGSDSEVMKTSDALIFQDDVSITEMENEDLELLREIILSDGDLRFVIKGHARDELFNHVVLLVEGGTLTYDIEGIVDATGTARILLETTFGSDAFTEATEGNRKLRYACRNPGSAGSKVCDAACKRRRRRRKKLREQQAANQSD